MKIKRLLALFMAAVIFTSGVSAFAETAERPDVSQTGGTSDTPDDEEQGEGYTPVDITGYTLWDGASDFQNDVNYYIDKQTDINMKTTRTLPEGSRLVIRDGGDLRIFVGSFLNLDGELLIEPNGALTISGTMQTTSSTKMDNLGNLVLTPSAVVNLRTSVESPEDSHINCAGTLNIYKSGSINAAGSTTIQSGSVVTVTGKLTIPESGKLFMRGQLLLTLSGKMDVAGYMSLSGELHNSGTLEFQEWIRFYRYETGKLMRSQSGRFNDHRRVTISQSHSSQLSNKLNIKGIDVSRYQNAIDWEKVAASGVEFAMIRLSLGSVEDPYNGQDSRSDYNITEALKAGIHVGVYHYLKAHTVEEARAEAQFMLNLLKNYKVDYPVVLDMEEPWQLNNLTNEERTEMARVFIDEIKAAGYYPMLYSSTNWLNNSFDMDRLSDVELWVADWRGYCGYTGEYGMWQYGVIAQVSGIEGEVDANIGYKDYAKIIRDGGFNHLDD